MGRGRTRSDGRRKHADVRRQRAEPNSEGTRTSNAETPANSRSAIEMHATGIAAVDTEHERKPAPLVACRRACDSSSPIPPEGRRGAVQNRSALASGGRLAHAIDSLAPVADSGLRTVEPLAMTRRASDTNKALEGLGSD